MSQAAAAAQQQPAAAAAVETEKQALIKKEFIKSHAGLTSVPVKVLVMGDLEVLDLSHNAIEVVPLGVFSDIPRLKSCDLSNNSIKSLPNDIAVLKELETLLLHHNCLATLPMGLFSLAGLSTLDLSFNRLMVLQQQIANMQGLQVLNLTSNRLRALPSDLGWLNLKQLSITDNPDLLVPTHVLQKGLRALLGYLQVVGEQHYQVDAHMSAFTSKLTELCTKHNLLAPGAFEDEEAAMLRLKLAQRLGVLSYSGCNLGALPALIADADAALADVQVVDLALNKLQKCPSELLGCINNLLVLNMAYNSLRSWPEGLFMPSLVVLNLSFNKLQQLPADMGEQLPALQQLYLANNSFSSLPSSLAKLELRDLFMSENSLQSVPEVLSRCTALVKLSLAACQLSGPCQQLAGLSQLRFLDLSFNQLTELSTELRSLGGLSTLNLGYNALGVFPTVLSCMTALRELNLDNTGISAFPRGLGELRHLEGLQADGCPLGAPYASLYAKDPLLLVALHDREQLSLDLTSCGLDAVPLDLLQQTQLTSLTLCKNNIQDLPPGLGNLRRLRQLGLKGNPLRQPFARLVDTSGELAVLALLRPGGVSGTLDLSACGFDTLPSLTWDLPGRETALLELHLTNNRLRVLPEELSRLAALSRLVLDSNSLKKLPPVVLQLPSLAVLQAAHNSITHLPEELGQMTALQAVMLSGNQLHGLPASISSLSRLRALSVASNRLWQLPQSLCDCTCLKLLDASHNLLGRLPQGMSVLVCLHSLKLTHNRLVWLPVDDLQPIKVLQELHVAGNCFEVPGIAHLNATGQQDVQQLLAAIARSGHGVPPPMHAHSQGRMSPLDASLSASQICGDAGEGWDAATAGPTPYASEAGGRGSNPGSRSASPTRRSLEAPKPCSSSGLLGVLKRIGSSAGLGPSLSTTAQEQHQQQPCSGSCQSDSGTAASSGSGAASSSSDAAASSSAGMQTEGARGHGKSSTGAQTAAQPSSSALKAGTVASSSGSVDVAEPVVGKHRPSVHFAAAEDEGQQQPSGSYGQQDKQEAAGPHTQELLPAQQAVDSTSATSSAHSHSHVHFSSDADPAAAVAQPSAAAGSGSAAPESPDKAAAATGVTAAADVTEQACAATSGDGAAACATSDTPQVAAASSKPKEPEKHSSAGKQAAKAAKPTTAAAAASLQNSGKPVDSRVQAAPAAAAPGATARLSPGAAAGKPAAKAAATVLAAAGNAPAPAAAQAATVKAQGKLGQHLQQHAPPAEPQRSAPNQQQQGSTSGGTGKQKAAVVATAAPSKQQPPALKAAGSDGHSVATPASPQPGVDASFTSSSVLRGTNLPPALLALLQGSDAASGRQFLDKVPIMDIPRVVRSCFEAPPPPSAAAPGQLVPARPQTKARFKRVLVQGAQALSLLEYGMQQCQQQQAPRGQQAPQLGSLQ